MYSSQTVITDADKRHTIGESSRTQHQKRGSRFKVRRSSLSSIVYRSENRVNNVLDDETDIGKTVMALVPVSNNKVPDSRIPSSLQTSPSIPDKRFANISRLPSVAAKKTSRGGDDTMNKSIFSRYGKC